MWTLDGDYVSSFGEDVLKYPRKITLTNGALFVTDRDQDCVFKFQLSNFKLQARYDMMILASAICSSRDEVFAVSHKEIIVVLNTDLNQGFEKL